MAATMRAEAVAVGVSSLTGGAFNSKCSTNTLTITQVTPFVRYTFKSRCSLAIDRASYAIPIAS